MEADELIVLPVAIVISPAPMFEIVTSPVNEISLAIFDVSNEAESPVIVTSPFPVIVSPLASLASKLIVPGLVTLILPVPLISAPAPIVIVPPDTSKFAFPISPSNVAAVDAHSRFTVPVIPLVSEFKSVWKLLTFTVPEFKIVSPSAFDTSIDNVAPLSTVKLPVPAILDPAVIFIVPLDTTNDALPNVPLKSEPVPLQSNVVVLVAIVE